MTPLAATATSAWIVSAFPAWLRFRRALLDPGRAQQAVLTALLHRGADTAFGREHRLDRVRTLADLQDAVPPRTYDELAPWITRAADGEAGVLTQEPVDRFEPSSGSTAARKLLPSTARQRAELNEGVSAWVFDLYRRRPGLMAGPSYWSISPVVRSERTPGGLPVGFEEDSAYLGGVAGRLVDAAMVVPGAVRHLELDTFWRATCLALLRCPELRLVSVWSPSFLTLLLRRIEAGWEGHLRTIADGVSLGPLRFPADPHRARVLERVGPRGAWPRLGLLSMWTDAAAAADVPAVRAFFPNVPVQPKGLLATEGIVSLPFGAQHPFAVTSHLVEVLRDDGVAVGVDALREGDEGAVLLTTGAGLWRYRLGDRIRVVGRVGRTPSIRFLGRQDRVSDLRGEKLNEAFVGHVLATLGVGDRFAMLAPEAVGDGYRYVLYVEGAGPPGGGDALEAGLRANPHYAWCREIGQLAPAAVVVVGPDAQQVYTAACQAAGQRLGDIKPTSLSPRTGWGVILRG